MGLTVTCPRCSLWDVQHSLQDWNRGGSTHDITYHWWETNKGDETGKLTKPATLFRFAREVTVALNKETLARAACVARGFADWNYFPSLGRFQSAAEWRTAYTESEILQARGGEFPLLCLATSFFDIFWVIHRPLLPRSFISHWFVCLYQPQCLRTWRLTGKIPHHFKFNWYISDLSFIPWKSKCIKGMLHHMVLNWHGFTWSTHRARTTRNTRQLNYARHQDHAARIGSMKRYRIQMKKVKKDSWVASVWNKSNSCRKNER